MEDKSAVDIAHEYIAAYQQGLCEIGWDANAEIQKSGILVYTPTADLMTRIIAQKIRRYRNKQEGLLAEVLRQCPDSVMFEMDGHSLPAGLAMQLAPEVSPGEREQARGEEERVRRRHIDLPSSRGMLWP